MTLWTASDAAKATRGRTTTDWSATGVSIDTRTLQPGDLFVALKAARDGHDFVVQALNNGAAAGLVSQMPDGVSEEAPLLIVDDVLAALENLGAAARARTDACVIAVTGSVGKTSTKDMLRHMLERQGRTHVAEASYNNHWGVPLTLARMPQNTQYAVVEIGMNHPGEIAPLTKLARPHVAIVTTVGAAHLQAFGSVEEIAREKASIFQGLEPDGTAIINGDLDTSAVLEKGAENAAKIIRFGATRTDSIALSIDVSEGTRVEAKINGHELGFSIGASGRHFAMNALAALSAVHEASADVAQAAADLSEWYAVGGRGARETITTATGAFTLIDDAYNANPISVAASLGVLAAAKTEGRRHAVLGDMKELGVSGPELHAALADSPAMAQIDRVHTVGPLMAHLSKALSPEQQGLHFDASAEMAAQIAEQITPGDTVMVKGSLSMGLRHVVDALRNMGQSGPERA